MYIYQANMIKINDCAILQTCLDQNRKTAYDLIASHGDVENLIFFAMLMQGGCLCMNWIWFKYRLQTSLKTVEIRKLIYNFISILLHKVAY